MSAPKTFAIRWMIKGDEEPWLRAYRQINAQWTADVSKARRYMSREKAQRTADKWFLGAAVVVPHPVPFSPAPVASSPAPVTEDDVLRLWERYESAKRMLAHIDKEDGTGHARSQAAYRMRRAAMGAFVEALDALPVKP